MQERWTNVQLDTPEKAEMFCETFYADVCDRAWKLTGDAEKAEELTEKVFAEVRETFRERGLPGDPIRYLRSCLIRLAENGASRPETADEAASAPVVPVVPAAQEPQQEHPLRAQTQFDADKTSLWLPGERFDHADLEAARQASRAKPKDTSNQRSVKLSIFNSALFITALLAAAYALYQLAIMMDML